MAFPGSGPLVRLPWMESPEVGPLKGSRDWCPLDGVILWSYLGGIPLGAVPWRGSPGGGFLEVLPWKGFPGRVHWGFPW
jgi:hypothetical protein